MFDLIRRRPVLAPADQGRREAATHDRGLIARNKNQRSTLRSHRLSPWKRKAQQP
jgi:hypothetical protein